MRRWRFWLLLAAALVLIGMSMTAWSLKEYERVETEEVARLTHQAKVVEANLAHQLQAVHAALGSIAADIPAWRGDNTGYVQALHLLQNLNAAMPSVNSFLITDARGIVVLSDQRRMLGQDASDVDYVKTPRQDPVGQVLYASDPYKSKSSDDAVHLSRALIDLSLGFDGVVSAAMEMGEVDVWLNSVRYAKDMQAYLVHHDGRILASQPQGALPRGTLVSSLIPDRALLADSVMESEDGQRLFVLRNIAPARLVMDKPLQVLLVRDHDAIVSGWYADIRNGALFFVFLSVVAVLALRNFENQRYKDIITAKRMRLATEASGVGIWEFDLVTKRYHWDSVMFTLFGLDPAKVGARIDEWQQLLSAPELERMRDATRQTIHQGQSFRLTFEIKRPDGQVRFLQNRATLHTDSGGMPRRLIGTTEDVTLRRQREAEVRVAAVAFESTDSMLVCDAKGDILRVNAAFTRLFQYAAAEAIGRSTSILISKLDTAAVFNEGWKCVMRDHYWRGELWSRRKDGQDIFCAVSATAVCDDTGEVTHFVATHSDITVRKAADDEVKRKAFYDALTGLPNRLLLADRLKQAVNQAHRNSGQLALMYMDLDKFKPVNDIYGHAVGDDLLRLVGQRMSACVRESDTVARIGGDEFVVLLPDIKQLQDAIFVAEKIHLQLRQAFTLSSGVVVNISMSSGISLYPTHGVNDDQLSKCADAAMYVAKRKGRDQFCVYSIQMEAPEPHATDGSTGSKLPKEEPPT